MQLDIASYIEDTKYLGEAARTTAGTLFYMRNIANIWEKQLEVQQGHCHV